MCDICRDLITCPMGSRRETRATKPRYSRFTDYYGNRFTVDGPVMVIDRRPNSTKCFIRKLHIDDNSVCYDFQINNIRYCPFCGENLIPPDPKPKTPVEQPMARIKEYLKDGTYNQYIMEEDI